MERNVIPVPVSVEPADGTSFTLGPSTPIVTPPGDQQAARVGEQLAAALRPATGYSLPVRPRPGGADRQRAAGAISLEVAAGGRLGDEGYELEVAGDAVTLRAERPAGLFHGVQTIRQLLPAAIDARTTRPGPWAIPGGRIVDRPRFAWRGAALDVARHFLTVAEVKRYVDLIALYKLNVLHLHLTDDQGWRIAIKSWPRLASHGGSTEVGGGPGGHYSQDDYREIVRYAQDRHITVVPEIDMPGHTNAALASYAKLNCNDRAQALYTGTQVGSSALCLDKPVTYQFIDDVVGEVAALTPGPYLHVGGDEADRVGPEDYARFMERVQRIVQAHGKRVVGWQEFASVPMLPTSVAQFWNPRFGDDGVREAARRGNKLILSPAPRTYFDMKYDQGTELGQDWAGFVEVRDAYEWDPAKLLDGVGEGELLGVESQLWSETIESIRDAEFMSFPRLPALAEVGWSPASTRDWERFRRRLAAHGPRWSAMGVNYHRSPQVPWPG